MTDTPAAVPAPARRLHRAIEPLHIALYFVPEQTAMFESFGLEMPALGYFPLRAAPLGRASAEVVAATFFNFNPDVVAMVVPAIWDRVSPERWIEARFEIIDAAYRRVFGDAVDQPEMAEAAALASDAAAACTLHGRPLYAANAAMAWPDAPHLRLFHAVTLIREWRGDGHIARLIDLELTAPQALVFYAATGEVKPGFLRGSRGWSREIWDEAQNSLRARGWLDADGELTETGRAARATLEDETDRLGSGPADALGEERLTRLIDLTRPFRRALADAGTFGAARA